ncbi:hypothetical protein ABPG72_011823 [Tetrahymena utriculariae]
MFSKPTFNAFKQSPQLLRKNLSTQGQNFNNSFNMNNYLTNRNLRLFNQIQYSIFNRNKNELEEIQKAKKNALDEMGDKYVYDRPSFQVVNNDKFLQKIKKLEEANKEQKAKLDGYKFPLLLIFFTLFIYYQWETIPYNAVFKHATISEYIPKEQYYHAIFTSALSMMNQGSLIVYGPALLYSLYLCGLYMRQRHMFYLFASNALVTCGITFFYERNKNQPVAMLTPKTHGAVTPLAFMSAFAVIKPDYYMFRNKAFPFFLIPAIYLMYECYEYKNYYVNEVCRPAHIGAMVYGAMFGLVFKRLML